jgi:hypothetical protein
MTLPRQEADVAASAHVASRTLSAGIIAEFGIELRMIDDVVAVQTAGTCLQIRRCIQMTDTELRQIRRQRRCIIETEMLMLLQPIGGARNHGTGLRRRLQRTGVLRNYSARVSISQSRDS